MSDVLNSTENSGIFSFCCGICIGLRSLVFGLLLVVIILIPFLDQCREISFSMWCFKHVLDNLFTVILACPLFIFCNLASFTILLL